MDLLSKINHYIETLDRSPNTQRAYRYALLRYRDTVASDDLTLDNYEAFAASLKGYEPSTKNQAKAAIMNFYLFYGFKDLAGITSLNKHYFKSQGVRVPNFDEEAVEQLIAYCQTLRGSLINLRDRAFVLTLADTGLRISEACNLKRNDINKGKAIIIGKGDKQATVRFTKRCLIAIEDYKAVRRKTDGATGKALGSLPLFARHDMSASKKTQPVTARGMWKAIKGDPKRGVIGRLEEAGLERGAVRIHDLRHYFVTVTSRMLGEKTAQELARHGNLAMTGRYRHLNDKELEQAFRKFDETR